MRVGIDARILGHKRSGIGVYVINLVEQFLKYKDLEILLFCDRPIDEEYRLVTGKVKTIIFGEGRKKYWSQFLLPAELKKHGINVYHATWNNAVPFFTLVPCVLTVHDIIPLVVKGYFKNIRKRFKYILLMRSAVSRARRIITVSDATKHDLLEHFKICQDKIITVYEAVASAGNSVVIEKSGIEGDYIVNVGSFDKRRNADILIKAFKRFVKNTNTKLKLVLTGGYDRFPEEIKRLKSLSTELGLDDSIVFTNYLVQRKMQAVLQGACMMVHLSLYEGFCFPVLEAMQLGVPVIASDRGSLLEVAGDAAILIDPTDEAAAAEVMSSLLNDANLRNSLVKKGYDRIKKFSWEETARQTKEIYEKVS